MVSGFTALSPATLPSTLTCEGSTRVGAGEDKTKQVPHFCPGDNMMVDTSVEIHRSKIKQMDLFKSSKMSR